MRATSVIALLLLLCCYSRCNELEYTGYTWHITSDGLLVPDINSQLLPDMPHWDPGLGDIPDYSTFTCDGRSPPFTCDTPFCVLCQEKQAMLCCEEISDKSNETQELELLYILDLDGDTGEQLWNLSASIVHIDDCGNPTSNCDLHDGVFLGSNHVEVMHIQHSNLGQMSRLDLVFQGLISVRVIYIEDCILNSWETVASGTSNKPLIRGVLPSLEVLSFRESSIEYLLEDAFEWLEGSTLKFLSLEGCSNIKQISAGVLLPVASSLVALELGYSSVGDAQTLGDSHSSLSLTNLLTSKLHNLRALGLAGAQLHRVPREALELVADSLIVLSMLRSTLDCFSGSCSDEPAGDVAVFPELPALRELSLAECQISVLPDRVLLQMPNLRALSLAGNLFSQFPPVWFLQASELRYLDVSDLDTSTVGPGPTLVLRGLDNLEVLDASFTELRLEPDTFCATPSLRALFVAGSVVLMQPPVSLQCLEGLEYLNVSASKALCSSFSEHFGASVGLRELVAASCPEGTFQRWENIEALWQMKSLELLDLSINGFVNLSSLHFVSALSNLTVLNLAGNDIVLWDDEPLAGVAKLHTLDLSRNSLSSISTAMIERFLAMHAVDVSRNSFLCYCSMALFSRFASALQERAVRCADDCGQRSVFRRTAFRGCVLACEADEERSAQLQAILDEAGLAINATEVLLHVVAWDDAGAYECIDNTGTKYMRQFKFSPEECFLSTRDAPIGKGPNGPSSQASWLVPTLASLAALVVVAGVLLVCCFKWPAIYQFGRAVRSVTLLRLLDDDDRDTGPCPATRFAYDVFISYSDPNRQWVLDHLVPNLESAKDLRVCLHERDFQVGLSILENIIQCMDESRSILLVVSQAFVRSHWCQFELHLAQHRLLETRREDLILVLLEEIPSSRRPKMLRYLMLTKTYIQWPGDGASPEAVKMFWRRLRQAVLLPRLTETRDSPA